MRILFILGLVLGGVTVVFALQNVSMVTVAFFTWQLQGSLAVVLLLAALAGVLTALFIILPQSIRNYFEFRKFQKENQKLAEELRKQKELTVFAKNNPVYVPELVTPEERRIIDTHTV